MALRDQYLSGRELLRERIPTQDLVAVLVKHALGQEELDPGRQRSIEILLRKVLPDLKAVDLTGSVELGPFVVKLGT